MKNIEACLSCFFIIISGVILWQASSMEYYGEFGPGPGLLPMWVAGLMLILSVVNLVQSLKRNNTQFSKLIPNGTGLINLLVCVGSFVLFMLIVTYAGFTLSSIIMLSLLFSRGYKWYWGVGMSIVITGVIFFAFGAVLGIKLPVNEFGW